MKITSLPFHAMADTGSADDIRVKNDISLLNCTASILHQHRVGGGGKLDLENLDFQRLQFSFI